MIYLMRTGLANAAETDRLHALPEFRKATRNMTMAYSSVMNLIGDLPTAWLAHCGLVFGTSHGELEATKEFLKILAVTKVARPTLFQNSLHNSTTGFIGMKLGLAGPAVTVSNGTRTAEESFDLARVLLVDGMINHCILTVADGIVPELKEVMAIRDEGTGEGAASLLLTTKPEDFSSRPLARFPNAFKTASDTARFPLGGNCSRYDTSAIEQLIIALNVSGSSGLSLLKRDGRYSELEWERLT